MAANGNRFLPLDRNGRDEGVAEVAATFVPGAEDAAAATPPLGRSFWWAGLAVLGTAAAAAAVVAVSFPAAPGQDFHPTGVTADVVPGIDLPNLLESDNVWANMPRGGTSTGVPRTPGTLAAEPGPAPVTVGPWSAPWLQGTVWFLNILIVMALLLVAVAVILQEP